MPFLLRPTHYPTCATKNTLKFTVCTTKFTKQTRIEHEKIMLAFFVYSKKAIIFAYPLKQTMPVSILDRIPKRKYTKTEICQLLADPENFIAGNFAAIKIHTQATGLLKRDVIRSGLLEQFGITEEEYDQLRLLTVTQGELILNKLM